MIFRKLLVLFSLTQLYLAFQNEEPLVVHICPHSHDDVGWLTTLENYYYGSRQQGDNASVQQTISSYVQALTSNSQRRFVQVEMAFLDMWWKESEEEQKQQFKDLIESGQLEIINGGWSSNDEATTYYENIIENLFVGHRFLKKELNVVPKVGWNIDAFGHSSAQASLFSQMGFDAWWFSRLDFNEKKQRQNKQEMEFIMNPPQASGKDNSIFTAINYNQYQAPNGFCFDEFCRTRPIQDDPNQSGYNVDSMAHTLVMYFQKMAKDFKTNQLFHVFGSDFQYTNAEKYMMNLDKLVKYINQHSNEQFEGLTIKYSTPSEYLQELNKQQVEFSEETNDFFPYEDNAQSFWTGYYSSRVGDKGMVRDMGKKFQVLRTYFGLLKYDNFSEFLNNNEELVESTLQTNEEVIGIMQHHDAVTGTEKQLVSNDYRKKMSEALDKLDNVMESVLNEQIKKIGNIDIPRDQKQFTYNWNSTAEQWNEIYDGIKNEKGVIMSVYNPTIQREQILKFKVPNSKFDLQDMRTNQYVDCEVFCMKEGECDAFFKTQLHSYSLNLFYVQGNKNSTNSKTVLLQTQDVKFEKFKLTENKSFQFLQNSNTLNYTCCNENNVCKYQEFDIQINKYDSYTRGGQRSGAYIFRPSDENGSKEYSIIQQRQIAIGKIVSILYVKGTQSWQTIQFSNLNSDYDNVLNIETFVDTIDVKDWVGKEIVIDIDTDIKNEDEFYTDSNGLELIKRKLDFRPSFDFQQSQQKTSSNYYPINAMIQIRDNNSTKQVSLLNDRAQGGSSLKQGRLELMIHRRILHDDARGVQESLNERDQNNQGITQKIRHWLVFSDQETQDLPREIQFNNDMENQMYFTQFDINAKTTNIKNLNFSLVSDLKKMTKLNLRYYGFKSGKYLMRLQNMSEYKKSEFEGLFERIQETTLTANQLLSENEKSKLRWGSRKRNLKNKQHGEEIHAFNQTIEELQILPLEIRTFNITSIF